MSEQPQLFSLESEPASVPLLVAQVLLDDGVDLIFSYSVPDAMQGRVAVGSRVRVHVQQRTRTGTVLVLAEKADLPYRVRPIDQLLADEPLISPSMLQLARWAANYYVVPMEQMVRCLLPAMVRTENTRPKTEKWVSCSQEPSADILARMQKKAPKQASIIAQLQAEPARRTRLADLGGTGMLASVRALQGKGFCVITDERVHRNPITEQFTQSCPLQLNEEQAMAYAKIQEMIVLSAHDATTATAEKMRPILLQGVTGSGKTEVYLQAVEQVVRMGKSAIIMVPEISLTPQTVARFKARFMNVGTEVAVLHSMLSDGERFDEWHSIRRGQARIVIGPRSAVFAPMQSLGIIIVDEEHDSSYKQDSSPRYHGRDIAVLRAHQEGAVVVLGSATPSLESIHNAQTGKYERVYMKQRADGCHLPLTRILDMRIEPKCPALPGILSERLRIAIDQRLMRGEQVILLLNRRGFARSLQCPDCGNVATCLHCAVPLTYHKTNDMLVCHLCGFQAVTPAACPECRSRQIKLEGYGTQKIEAGLIRLFAHAKVQRIDADVARSKKNAMRDILNDFRARKIDILLGTQMIAKGLDFPNVTLVGVLNADLGLYVPDVRASEHTFQLLTQVAGRAGRGEVDGEVMVQTLVPHSPALQFARSHDTDGFATQELELRRMFNMPPYTHVALLMVRCEHEEKGNLAMQTLHKFLLANKPEHIEVMDPTPSAIPRAHNQFRFQLTLKAANARPLANLLRRALSEVNFGKEITSLVDIDAMSFV